MENYIHQSIQQGIVPGNESRKIPDNYVSETKGVTGQTDKQLRLKWISQYSGKIIRDKGIIKGVNIYQQNRRRY
jgi:hypothetical protein